MTCTSTAKIDTWLDQSTDQRLLPSLFIRHSNRDTIQCYEIALRMAMRNFLTPDQRDILHMHYWQGMSKTQIAATLGVTPSAICKRMRAAEQLLREHVAFCVEVYTAISRTDSQRAKHCTVCGSIDVVGDACPWCHTPIEQ